MGLLRLLFIGFMCVSVTSGALAQEKPDKATLAAAAKAVEVTGVVKQFDNIINALTDQVRQGLAGSDPAFLTDAELKANLETAMNLAKAEAESLKPQLDNDIVQLYAKRFTLDELKEINAFLTSPVGQKFSAEAPKLMADSIRLSQYWAAEMTKAINRRAREELEKRGYKFN